MFIISLVPMNKVKLLVHGREVSIEQQQVVQARVIWYVPCIPSTDLIYVYVIYALVKLLGSLLLKNRCYVYIYCIIVGSILARVCQVRWLVFNQVTTILWFYIEVCPADSQLLHSVWCCFSAYVFTIYSNVYCMPSQIMSFMFRDL